MSPAHADLGRSSNSAMAALAGCTKTPPRRRCYSPAILKTITTSCPMRPPGMPLHVRPKVSLGRRLEDWGYDTVVASDKFGRLSFGMPPASNGDWAWLQQIAKSLKEADPDTGLGGQGMVVMSQGVLFRGQPEQTEEEDGQNQKADAEYVIRRGFIEADLIEAVVVLPGKLFYGNGVPGCLVLINKAKPSERKDKILMIWASRHYLKGNLPPSYPAASRSSTCGVQRTNVLPLSARAHCC